MADKLTGADITPNYIGDPEQENTKTVVDDNAGTTEEPGKENNTAGTGKKNKSTGTDNTGIDYSAIVLDGLEVDEKDLTAREKSNVTGCKNLVPFTERSEEEVKALNSKGGKKSGETRRKQRDMRAVARAILEHSMKDDQIQEVLGTATDLLDGDKSVMAVLTARMVQEAGKGNYKAYETIRDTAGFKPKDQVETTVDIMTDADRALIGKIASRLEKQA